ncbi:ECF transporter S component [Mycoplasmopsis felifaucium]|uniref:ECF transporter S component n=1 Tax=Mycoplasmopsis felifaucium TaxID=35768 RepID=A0ABZ2RV66_9BACT|nr:ECF transporter S component [Mycoplasmopsis felifaucium]
MNTKQSKWNKFNDFITEFKILPKLSIRKIAFIGILIAISVVIFVIFASFVPLISIPTYKISFIGLPIKISGFIFGPIVGGIVGLISDLISFAMFPTFYNIYYTLAAVVDGVISGLIGILFLKILKFVFGGAFRDAALENRIYKLKTTLTNYKLNDQDANKIYKLENKIILLNEKRKQIAIVGTEHLLLNANLIASVTIMSLACLAIFIVVFLKIDDSTIKNFSVIPNKTLLIIFMLSGYICMIIFLIISRYKMKPKHYSVIVPIVIFSALIELVNVPLLSLADYSATNSSAAEGTIITYMFQHIMFSPIKIWFNMFVIFFTYNIVAPLINKNNDIMY